MRTVAIISRKGGAGKTNIAVHLAACAEGRSMRAGIVDLDPQATSTKWAARRAENASLAGADVVSAQAFSLPKLLAEARGAGARLMLLDTAPHADAMAVDAARAADFVLIPCRPAIADIEAIPASADIARLAGKPFAVVLNAAIAQGTRADGEPGSRFRTEGARGRTAQLVQERRADPDGREGCNAHLGRRGRCRRAEEACRRARTARPQRQAPDCRLLLARVREAAAHACCRTGHDGAGVDPGRPQPHVPEARQATYRLRQPLAARRAVHPSMQD